MALRKGFANAAYCIVENEGFAARYGHCFGLQWPNKLRCRNTPLSKLMGIPPKSFLYLQVVWPSWRQYMEIERQYHNRRGTSTMMIKIYARVLDRGCSMSIRGFAFPRRVWVIKTVPVCTLIDQNKRGYGYGTRINFISFTIERKK